MHPALEFEDPGREDEATPVAAQGAPGARGPAVLAALGGAANVRSVDACTTRLRLVVADFAAVNEGGLKALGARGVLKLDNGGLQVVFGPVADQIAGEVRQAIASGPVAPPSVPQLDVAAIVKALGAGNVRSVRARGTRLLVDLNDPAKLDEASLRRGGILGIVISADAARPVHLIAGDGTAQLAAALQPAT